MANTTQTPSPFYLGNLLRTHGLQQNKLVQYLKADGQFIMSPTTLNKLIREGRFPQSAIDNRDEFDDVIKAYLIDHGVSRKDADLIWDNGTHQKPKVDKVAIEDRVRNQLNRDNAKSDTFITPELTMLSQKTLRHFGLHKQPFENEVNEPDDLFMDEQQYLAREKMIAATLTPSILALIAESGAGKTHVVMTYREYLRQNEPNVIVIEPKVSNKKSLHESTIMFAMARTLDIKLPPDAEQRAWVAQNALEEGINSGFRYVLLIEEAHLLKEDVLRMLKSFSEWKTGFSRMLSIILIGQNELTANLAPTKKSVREFSRRCTVVGLYPLGDSLPRYLAHKFERAGCSMEQVFTDCGLEALRQKLTHKRSMGNMQRDELVDMSYALNVNCWTSQAMEKAAEVGDRINKELIEELKIVV